MSVVEGFRQSALKEFEKLTPINLKSDEFKYTSLEQFSLQKFSSDMASKMVTLKNLGDEYPGAKVIRLSSSSSDIETSGNFEFDGISVLPWAEFQKKYPELFLQIAAAPEKLAKDAYAQWTAAHASHAIVVKIAKNTHVKETIQIIHRLDSSLMAHRLCLLVEEGASCSILEEYRSVQSSHFVPAQAASLVHVIASKNSKIEWNQVQALPESVSTVIRAQVQADRDAQVSGSVVSLGSQTSHYHLEFCACGENANLDFICASLGTKSMHCDFFIRNSHPAKHSTSQTKIISVVSDESTSVFNGMIEIPLHAPKVDAAHRAKSLVLSPKARVQSNPKLEIATDDVKCAHGSSISSIDPSQLYYLQSRGISRSDAESMIVDSFLNPALDRIPVDGVRSHYKGLVSRLRPSVAASAPSKARE